MLPFCVADPLTNHSELSEETDFKRVELLLLDLSNFASVIKFADQLNEDERIDILVQNAGVLPEAEYTATKDGWETTYASYSLFSPRTLILGSTHPRLQVNHLAPSLLTILLLPKIISTAENFNTQPCIVVVSSGIHLLSKLDKDLVDGPHPLKTLGGKEYCTPEILQKRYADSKGKQPLSTPSPFASSRTITPSQS